MDPLAELFRRFAARGDVGALGEVFDRTAPRLLRLALHLARSPEDAEDLVQATFVLAMRKAATFADDAPLLPWLAGILAGEARNLGRRNVQRRAEPLPDLVDADAATAPPADAERRELIELLRGHIETLPREQRQVLLLQLQHGLSAAAIGEVLDVAPGTVRMRLHRGLRALRKLLPSGLAAWLAGALPARGLAGVRAAVLREAAAIAGATGATGATVTIAAAVAVGAIMKKTFLAVAALLLALAGWWLVDRSRAAPAPGLATTRAANASAAAPLAAGDAAALPDARSVAREPAPAAAVLDASADATGALRVELSAIGATTPLVGVAVRVWPGEDAEPPGDGSDHALRTDAAGVAHFAALAPGRWSVAVPGFGDGTNAARRAAGADVPPDATAALPLGLHVTAVRGVVVDPDGAPVANAAVVLSSMTDSMLGPLQRYAAPARFDLHQRVAARTGPDGTFVALAGPDEDHVAATHPGFAPARPWLTHAVGLAHWRLQLRANERTVRGVVRTSDGRAVAGAHVAARVQEAVQRARDGTWLGTPLPALATTDGAGRFELGALGGGDVVVWASAPGHATANTFVRASQLGAVEVDIELPPRVVVRGSVHAAAGAPLAGLDVQVRHDGVRHALASARTSAGGAFVLLAPPPPFALEVRAVAGGEVLLRHEVAAAAPPPAALRLVLPPWPTLRGAVLDAAGAPLSGWSLRAASADGSGERWTRTDAEGRVVLEHLAAPRWHLSVGDTRAPAAERSDVDAHAGEFELRVPAERLPRGRIAGRLVDGSGAPLATTTVLLRVDGQVRHEATSDPAGRFVFAGLAAADFELALPGSDSARPRRLRAVASDGARDTELGDVDVPAPATLVVDVVDADGSPWRALLPDVWLLRDGQPTDWLPHADGARFTGAIAPGPVRVAIEERDLLADAVALELQPGEHRRVQLALRIGRSFELVFAGEREPTIDHRDVLHAEVLDARGSVVLREQLRRSRHGDGNWTIGRVFALGAYEVVGRTDSGRRYRAAFVVDDAANAPRSRDVPLLR